jgi:hypothetical protein
MLRYGDVNGEQENLAGVLVGFSLAIEWRHRSGGGSNMRGVKGGVGLCAGLMAALLMSCGGGSDSTGSTEGTSEPVTVSEPAMSVATTPVDTDAPAGTESPSSAAVVSTTAAPSTTEVAATTTTVDPRPIDPEDQALALAATSQAADFASPWVVYSEGAPAPVTTESCAYRPDGAATLLTNGASQAGPTMQLGDTGAFVSSGGIAFPDESLAMEFIGVLNTDGWATCRTEQLQQFQQDNGSDRVVQLATREAPSLNQSGFESYAEFSVNTPAGELERVVMISFYRLGRTVLVQTVEYGALSDSDLAKMTDDAYTALSKAYERVNALP